MRDKLKELDRIFHPKVVAIVGDKRLNNNYMWLRSMSTLQGKLYSVNIDPNEAAGIEALGITNCKSLLDIPEEIDYVYVSVPREVVPGVIKDCIRKKMGGVALFTSGYHETNTEEGRQLADGLAPGFCQLLFQAISGFQERFKKPFLVILPPSPAEQKEIEVRGLLTQRGIPSFNSYLRCGRALKKVADSYGRRERRGQGEPLQVAGLAPEPPLREEAPAGPPPPRPVPKPPERTAEKEFSAEEKPPDRPLESVAQEILPHSFSAGAKERFPGEALKILDRAIRKRRRSLSELEAKAVLEAAGISVIPTRPAHSEEEAASLAREIQGFPLLEGYRGREPVDLARLKEVLLRVSDLAAGSPVIREMDLNPLFGYRDGVAAVDARIILET